MSDNGTHLVQRLFATRFLQLEKMKQMVPRTVKAQCASRRITVAEVVFDTLHIDKVNAKFKRRGFVFDDRMHVIAVTDDGSILLWGGANSVFHLRRGQRISGPLDEKHLVFEDISHLTDLFEIEVKKKEVDEMISQLKRACTPARK
jgi:hypothetical protein